MITEIINPIKIKHIILQSQLFQNHLYFPSILSLMLNTGHIKLGFEVDKRSAQEKIVVYYVIKTMQIKADWKHNSI